MSVFSYPPRQDEGQKAKCDNVFPLGWSLLDATGPFLSARVRTLHHAGVAEAT